MATIAFLLICLACTNQGTATPVQEPPLCTRAADDDSSVHDGPSMLQRAQKDGPADIFEAGSGHSTGEEENAEWAANLDDFRHMLEEERKMDFQTGPAHMLEEEQKMDAESEANPEWEVDLNEFLDMQEEEHENEFLDEQQEEELPDGVEQTEAASPVELEAEARDFLQDATVVLYNAASPGLCYEAPESYAKNCLPKAPMPQAFFPGAKPKYDTTCAKEGFTLPLATPDSFYGDNVVNAYCTGIDWVQATMGPTVQSNPELAAALGDMGATWRQQNPDCA